ncbi:rhamnogalacturonan lyase family protein [Paenibacillus sp. CAU 1782]
MKKQTKEPAQVQQLDISQAGLRCKMLLGDLDGDGRMEIVMVQPNGGIDDRYVPHQAQCLTAFDLDGRLLWQVGVPDPNCGGPGSDYPAQLYDIDGDGRCEVLCVMNKRFLILDGQTGQEKRSFELPSEWAHDCIIIANLSGGAYPADIILKDRYQTLWAVDNELRLLWTYAGNPGHFPWVFDFDGDGRDEVMAGYDLLDHDGKKLWSAQNLDDHADCIWVGDVLGRGDMQIVIGGSVTVMYDAQGKELWRYEGSIESQHIALGKFRGDLNGLQIAGLDRITRGDTGDVFSESGKDGLFLLDSQGKELWKENRQTNGWLTIVETLSNWDDGPLDYILAYRRGGGVPPTLYDGHMAETVRFPNDGYVAHADLTGSGQEQVLIYNQSTAWIYASRPIELTPSKPGEPLPQPKRLYSSTLYPGGEYR